MKPSPSLLAPPVVAFALGFMSVSAFGQVADQIWNTAGPSNNWNTADANWDAGSVWVQGDNAIFGGTGETVTLTAAINAANLTFGAGGYTITGNTLTLAAAGVIDTGAFSVTLNSSLAGGPISKSGTGTLVLGGTNTFTGGLAVNAGTLQANAYNSMSAGPVTVEVTGTDNATLYHTSTTGESATNIQIAGSGSGLAVLKWNQDWWGTTGKGYNTYNDWTLTLNRPVNFQCASSGKQISGLVTGSPVAGGEVAVKIDGGTQVTWTSAMNSSNNAVQVNSFTGNVWVTGNTKLQAQNRAYQVNSAAYCNGLIPDTATVIVDAGSTLQFHHGAETIGFLSGAGTVAVGTGTNGNQLTLAGNAETPTTGPGTLGAATFSGTFSTNQSALVKNGTGTQEFSGAGLTFTAGVNLNNGTLRLTKTTAWGSNIAVGTSNNATLQLNAALAADSWTFSKQITGGAATATLEKIGPGTVTLAATAGTPTFGALVVGEGRLNLNVTAPYFAGTKPATTVAGTGILSGKASLGPTTLAAGARLEGGSGGSGTLTMESLSFAGPATLSGTPSASSAPLVVTNTLTSSGTTVTISLASMPPTNGTYHLIQFGTLAGTLDDFQLESAPRSAYLALNGGFLDLVVDSTNHPIWMGYSAEWSAYPLYPQNWKLSGDEAPTDFQNLDSVEFNDSAPGTTDIEVSHSDVAPGLVTFDNSTKDYTLGGTLDITSGSLTKKGSGRLTISRGYSFTGGSTLLGGIVSLATETGLGTGNRTFDGGALEFSGSAETWTRGTATGTAGGTLAVTQAASVLTHAGPLTGSGILTKSGAGTLLLPFTSGTITTPLRVAEGTLTLDYGSGNVTYGGTITGNNGVLRLQGTGLDATHGLSLAGNSTFAGEVHVYGRRVFLDSPTANAALSGSKIIIKNGNWPSHCLSLNRNEQIADTTVLRFENTTGAFDFRLNGKTETLAGLESLGGPTQGDPGSPGNWAMIENAGYDGGNDSGLAAGTLVVAGSGSYAFHGQLRNQNGGTNGVLNFTKTGTGTQVLDGLGVTYTGATTVNGGLLELRDTTNFGNGGLGVLSGTLQINHTTNVATTSATGSSAVTVESGATLAGIGRVGGPTTVKDGGFVAPGLAGLGTLTLANATLSGTYLCQTDAASSDLLAIPGTLAVDGGTRIVFSGTTGAASYTILTYGTLAGALPALAPPSGYTVDTSTAGVVRLVKTATGFDSWADSFAGLTDKTPGGDPDGDGIPNLLEYVLGGDPRVSSTSILPTRSIAGDDLVLAYTRSDDSETDTTQTGQWSTDLATWHDIAPVSVDENGPDPDSMEIRIPRAHAVNGLLFGRLQVTKP